MFHVQSLSESALDFGKSVLKPGGIFLCKLWDGYGTQGRNEFLCCLQSYYWYMFSDRDNDYLKNT